MTDILLEVRDLVVEYGMGKELLRPVRRLRAVNGVSFVLRAGETLGLVGESGCGKTSLARAVMIRRGTRMAVRRLCSTRIVRRFCRGRTTGRRPRW